MNSKNSNADSFHAIPLLEKKFCNEVLDAEAYQSIHRIAKLSRLAPVMDLDAIQRAMFSIKPRVCEEMTIAS